MRQLTLSLIRPVGATLVAVGLATCAAPADPLPQDADGGRSGAAAEAAGSPLVLGVNADGDYPLVRQTGIVWVRANLRWRDVQPAPDAWDFSLADERVAAARREGLEVLGILGTPPEWAGGGALGNDPPAAVEPWREYVRRMARRYAGRVAAWEIWNEPDLRGESSIGVGWDEGLREEPRYADYLAAAAEEIRAADPEAKVVAPAASSRPDRRTRRLYRQLESDGGWQAVDAVSFHANGGDRAVGAVEDSITRHLRMLSRNAPSACARPVWITEWGWRSGDVGEAGQADRVARLARFLDEAELPCGEITHAFVYLLIDEPVESAGLFREDGSAKPVVEVVRERTR